MSAGSVTVLRASDDAERQRWAEVWSKWPGREVFAHPSYLRLYESPGQEGMAAILEMVGGIILYPFLRRSLAEEPFVPDGLKSCYDLVTPYGYGGPFFFGDSSMREEVSREFWAAFDLWAREQRCVSEFVRFSLFPEGLAPYPGKVECRGPNVVRALDLPGDQLWMDFEHKVRKNVKKARRMGASVEVDSTATWIDDFLRIYERTMERRKASRFYYFSRSYFESMARNLAGQHVYFHVVHGGKVVSTELLLISANSIYSFLGGTLEEAFDVRPNDLLKYEAILWARERGLRWFVLGGGYKPSDGIYRYKLSFAPGGERPFRIGQRIFAPEAYRALVEAKARYESGLGHKWEAREGYFPAYRG